MSKKDLVLFPGCSLDGAASEYGHSTRAVMDALGKPIRVLKDWNCCGAMAARNMDAALSSRLAGRNLALAAKEDCDVLVNCAACYNNLAFSRDYVTKHPEAWAPVEGELPTPQSAEVFHLLSVLTERKMLDLLRCKIAKPLSGMKLACYYGCLLVRPGGYTNVDDPENPQTMDELMRICGADAIDWSYKTDCCGQSTSMTNKDSAIDLIGRIFTDAMAQGADGLVAACPLCHMNLDAWQKDVGTALGKEVKLPVYYFTELLAAAMDLPGVDKWLGSHFVDARPALGDCR